jgi:hypothetical protein
LSQKSEGAVAGETSVSSGFWRLLERRPVLFFLLLLLLARSLFLVAALDASEADVREVFDASAWSPVPTVPLYDPEELFYGSAAEAMNQGLGLPLLKYRYLPYSSGSLLVALLAVPFYKILGPSYLVFKLVPLALTLLCGAAWFGTTRAWFGPRAGWLFGALFIFAPSALVRAGLIGYGNHPEGLAALGVVFYLATRAAHSSSGAGQRRWAFSSGVATGFSVFVSYSVLPTLGGVGATALIATRARPRVPWVAYLSGIALGSIPWLWAIGSSRSRVPQVYGKDLISIDLGPIWAKFQALGAGGFGASYDLPSESWAAAAAAVFFLAVLWGWSGMLRAWRQPVVVLALAGTVAHLGAYLLRAPDASSRYLMPSYALLLFAICWPVAGGRGASRWRLAPCVAVIGFGIASQLSVIGSSSFPALRTPFAGTQWAFFGEVVGHRLAPDVIEAMPDQKLASLTWVGQGRRLFVTSSPADWRVAAAAAGDPAAAMLWRGVGMGWMDRRAGRGALDYLAKLPLDDRDALLGGLLTRTESAFSLVPRARASLAAFLANVRARDRPRVAAAMAYNAAVGATQGVALEPEVERWIADADFGTRAAAAGRALYRDTTGTHGIRFWEPAETAWTHEFLDRLRAGHASDEVWQGIGASYARDLVRRVPSAVLGQTAPTDLAAELSRLTLGLSPEQSWYLYQAGGRACAWLRGAPYVSVSSAWRWQAAMPAAQQAAFQRGFDFQLARAQRPGEGFAPLAPRPAARGLR